MGARGLIDATEHHARRIVPLFAERDRASLDAVSDGHAADMVVGLVGKSSPARCLVLDGTPAAICGGIPHDTGCHVWWLVTPAFARSPHVSVRAARQFIQELQARYSALTGAVDLGYAKTVRLVKWLGFSFADPVVMDGATIVPMELCRDL